MDGPSEPVLFIFVEVILAWSTIGEHLTGVLDLTTCCVYVFKVLLLCLLLKEGSESLLRLGIGAWSRSRRCVIVLIVEHVPSAAILRST
jgi:hypothetical protein